MELDFDFLVYTHKFLWFVRPYKTQYDIKQVKITTQTTDDTAKQLDPNTPLN